MKKQWNDLFQSIWITIVSFLKNALDEEHKKIKGIEFMGLLANVLTIATYCSIKPVLAEYQDIELLYYISFAAVWLMSVYAFWQFLCLIGSERLGWVIHSIAKVFGYVAHNARDSRFLLRLVCAVFGMVVFAGIILFNWHSTSYYASVEEIYGIPKGVGMPLSSGEREERSDYWKIEKYQFRKHIRLTYIESYRQLDIMREYSTIYNMALFQPSARIEYTCKKNEDKYRSYGEKSYTTAREQGFWEPQKISYYNSSGKLLLEEQRNDGDKFEIQTYVSKDMPQLLHSTLLRIPDGQTAESGITSRQIETRYNSDGLPETRRLNPFLNNQYGVNGERYTYDGNKRMTSLCYLDVNGEPACNKNGIMLVTFQYEENGNLRSIRYYSDEEGEKKTEGFNGVFCEKFDYDAYGNLIERRGLGRDENWQYDDNGIHLYRYTYEKGALDEEAFYGIGNKPIRESRYDSRTLHFEEHGKFLGREIFIVFDTVNQEGESDALMDEEFKEDVLSVSTDRVLLSNGLNKDKDKETQEETVDEDEEDMSDSFDGDAASLQTSVFLSGIAKDQKIDTKKTKFSQDDLEKEDGFTRAYTSIHYSIDLKKRIEEKSYHGYDGDLVACGEGYAIQHFSYDMQRRVTSEFYLNFESNPCYVKGGYSEIRREYGTDHKILSVEYLDADGKLTNHEELGYASVKYERTEDEQGRLVTSSFFDRQGEPVLLPQKGYALVERFYNESGLLEWEAYYDGPDSPVCRIDCKAAKVLHEYAEDGNLIKTWYQGLDGEPVNRSDTGYAAVYWEYENGKCIGTHYEGYQNQKFAAVPDRGTGIAAIKYTYNDQGWKEREEFFDTEEKPALQSDMGCASLEYNYDEVGRINGETYRGTDQKLVIRRDRGYASVKFEIDEFGQRSSSRYYGVDGEPIISRVYQCAGYEYGYDDRGNNTDHKFIGVDGNPMVRRDLGYASVHMEYDSEGNETAVYYYDAEGKPAVEKEGGYASCKKKFEKGKMTEARYYGIGGKPVIRKDKGYAAVICVNGDHGKDSFEFYYDVNEQPIVSTEYLCAGREFGYDEYGNVSEVCFLGTDGKKIMHRDWGYAQVKYKNNLSGTVLEASYYDAEGKPVVCKDFGCASYHRMESGENLVEFRYYDTNGELMLRKDAGCAIIRDRYDEFGQCIEESYYGVDEKPVINSNNHCAKIQWKYDERGNQTDSMYIGLDGKWILNTDYGCAKCHSEYDALGQEITVAYFGVWEERVARKDNGCSYYENQYDEYGNCIETRYYDTE